MTNIRTLITQLDELREKTNKDGYKLRQASGGAPWKTLEILEPHDEDAEYIVALYDAYPMLKRFIDGALAFHEKCSKLTPEMCDEAEQAIEALRTAALEREKYKTEHEKLTGFIDELKSLKVYEDESYEIACDNLINKWKV